MVEVSLREAEPIKAIFHISFFISHYFQRASAS